MPSDTLYTPQQKARCVAWYAATQSQAQVQINFRREYGRNAQVPSSSGILNWYNKFLETGTLNRKKKDSNKWVLTPEMEQTVLNLFRSEENKRELSTRKAAAREDTPSRTSIRRVLKTHRFHSYKIQHHQKLTGVASA